MPVYKRQIDRSFSCFISANTALYRLIYRLSTKGTKNHCGDRVAGLSRTILLADSLLEISLRASNKQHRKFSWFIPGFFPPISGLIP